MNFSKKLIISIIVILIFTFSLVGIYELYFKTSVNPAPNTITALGTENDNMPPPPPPY